MRRESIIIERFKARLDKILRYDIFFEFRTENLIKDFENRGYITMGKIYKSFEQERPKKIYGSVRLVIDKEIFKIPFRYKRDW